MKRKFICGWWFNYATKPSTEDVYNFSLLYIGNFDSGKYVDGTAFEVFVEEDGELRIEQDGKFKSTMSQYETRRMCLAFHFTVTDSEKVEKLGRSILGFGEYYFQGHEHMWPVSYSGQFTSDSLTTFCSVKGFKITDKTMLKNLEVETEQRQLKIALRHAIDKGWVDRKMFNSVEGTLSISDDSTK